MTLHLAEISTQVTKGAHAVVILDQAGWHTANDLDLPDNISLLFLPPYSPELNPIENLFQFLQHNFLNARVYDTYEDIVDACCWAWNSLIKINRQLKSMTTKAWTKTVRTSAGWYKKQFMKPALSHGRKGARLARQIQKTVAKKNVVNP